MQDNDFPQHGAESLSLESILGQEFLTWLWFCSEMRPTLFVDSEKRPFNLSMEQSIVVQGGEGASRETATVSGASSKLREARLGLKTGKKVTKAKLFFEQDSLYWQCVLKAEDFALSAFKTPKIEKQEDDDPDALFLEKMYLIERGFDLLDSLYALFIKKRLNKAEWQEECQEIRTWIREEAND